MSWRSTVGAALIVVAASAWSAGFATAADLAVGDLAPEFILKGSDGATHSLEQLRGKRAVVLAWFPKALTGG